MMFDQPRPGRPVAIIGAGMIGGVHHRAARTAGADVIGVLASSPLRSVEVAQTWGVTTGFADLGEVLASSAEVVHICTPNATHAAITRAALAAGKQVICEKPLGVSLDEAVSMSAAVPAGTVATVPFVYRYHPLVHEIRARRIAGEFGSWNLLHGSYLQDWMLDQATNGWRVDPAHGGRSRAFADIGSHWCDLVEWVSGERIVSLSAVLSTAYSERGLHSTQTFGRTAVGSAGTGSIAVAERETVAVTTEDSAIVSFRTAAGVIGSVTVSQVAAGRKNRLWFELDGALGSAVFDQEKPETIWLGSTAGATILARDPRHGSVTQRSRNPLPAGHSHGYQQCFDDFVADTYAAIDGAAPESLPTFADGLRSAALVDALLRSASTGAWVDVASSPTYSSGT